MTNRTGMDPDRFQMKDLKRRVVSLEKSEREVRKVVSQHVRAIKRLEVAIGVLQQVKAGLTPPTPASQVPPAEEDGAHQFGCQCSERCQP